MVESSRNIFPKHCFNPACQNWCRCLRSQLLVQVPARGAYAKLDSEPLPQPLASTHERRCHETIPESGHRSWSGQHQLSRIFGLASCLEDRTPSMLSSTLSRILRCNPARNLHRRVMPFELLALTRQALLCIAAMSILLVRGVYCAVSAAPAADVSRRCH